MKEKNELSETNMKAIEQYLNKFKTYNSTPTTIRNQFTYLRMFLKHVGKDYNKMTLDDILRVFGSDCLKPTTREVIKPTVRKFLIHHGMNDLAKEIISNGSVLAKPTKGRESVLNPEEIDKLIDTPHELDRKALMEIFLVVGARLEEIQTLNLGDVNIDGDIIYVNIRVSKTDIREVPIVPDERNPCARYPEHLVKYVRSRSNDDPTTPLFYSHNYGNKKGRLSKPGVYAVIKSIHKDSGITKNVSPHILRHTCATYFGQFLNENMLGTKFGWAPGSAMMRRYCHTNEAQLKDELLRRAGLKQEEVQNGKSCFNCGEINEFFAKECKKCHQILDAEKLKQIAQNKIDINTEYEGRIATLESRVDSLVEQLEWFINKGTELMNEKIAREAPHLPRV